MLRGVKSIDLVDSLTLSCIRHNFVEFVEAYGYTLAVIKIAELFGSQWDKCALEVMQWYDQDYRKQA